jgi:two-component system, LytTR family, response regulator
MLRTLIADDEPLARQALRRFLGHHDDIRIVAEAEDVEGVRTVLRTTPVDLVLLDVTMPGGSGLDVAAALPAGAALIFTTAHAEHAARAFELDAVDYLVKPFGGDRVRDALDRVRRRRASGASAPTDEVLLVRIGARLHPVPLSGVWRFSGADDYVEVVTAQRTWLHATTLGALEARLDPARFLRVHRRHLVQLSHVVRVEPQGERQLALVFPDGSRVVGSRTGSSALRRLARTDAADRTD